MTKLEQKKNKLTYEEEQKLYWACVDFQVMARQIRFEKEYEEWKQKEGLD